MTKGQLADNVLHVYSTVQKSGSHWETEQPCLLTLRKYLCPLIKHFNARLFLLLSVFFGHSINLGFWNYFLVHFCLIKQLKPNIWAKRDSLHAVNCPG